MLNLRDIYWHRAIAKRPKLLMAMGIGLPLACVVAAYFIGEFVRWQSASDLWNYIWMVVHVGACVAAGWLLAMVAGTLLFGDDWRASFLTGSAYSEGDAVDRMMSEGKDRSAAFLGLIVVCTLFTYGLAMVVGGNFLFKYDRFAAPMTLVRSEVPAQQVAGLESLARDQEYSEAETLAIREQAVAKLGSDHAEVRARAAWAVGQLGIVATRDQLIDALNDDAEDVRLAAAVALARLGLPETASTLMETFPASGNRSEASERAWLTALGLTEAREISTFIRERFDALHSANHDVAYWAIGRSSDTCAHRFLMKAHTEASNPSKKCVIADGLKRVATEEDVSTVKSWLHPGLDHWCERQSIDGPAVAELGSRDMVILASQESLREKYMDTVFNIAADGAYEWYDSILRDDRYSNTAREHAYFLMKTWQKAPSRSVRTADDCETTASDSGESPTRVPVELPTDREETTPHINESDSDE